MRLLHLLGGVYKIQHSSVAASHLDLPVVN
jgi:hypothetical protein